MLPYLRQRFGNPSSQHVYGRAIRRAVDHAREQVAELIDCDPEEVIFTSGGTESNNLAIRGVTAALPERRHLLTSVIEHPATAAPCAHLERLGYRIDRVTVDGYGRVRVGEARRVINEHTVLVSIMHSNSETGSLQAVSELADLAHEVGALIHTDAAQSVGKLSLSVRDEGVDLLSVAGHKRYAPQGIGALFVRQGTPLLPLLLGASHERGLRPGTENVASIVGLGTACQIARKTLGEESIRVQALRDRLWSSLATEIPDLALNGHPTERLPNTLNVRFPGVSGNALLAACPEIAASTGSACHASDEHAFEVITAMGIGEREALGSVRLSLGRSTRPKDVRRAAKAIVIAWRSVARN